MISELCRMVNTLHHLNYRVNMEALALWQGQKPPFAAYRIYEGFDEFLHLDTLAKIEDIPDPFVKSRLRHAFIDHYLQRALHPHEMEMRTWMRGAAAHVKGRKIYFGQIIPWCQKSSTYEERQVLQKETGPLCKFLKPFALNYWELLMKILKRDLGFLNYVDYCARKKHTDYAAAYEMVRALLEETDELYFPAMEAWSRERFGRPLADLTRFDAICLLGLGEFDTLYPCSSLEETEGFFRRWEIDPARTSGLHLLIGREEDRSTQAMCFILEVPEEVYVLVKPEGGWVDLESFWHELGHGLSAVHTSSRLSVVERDLATSFRLSEAYAFLLQNMSLSPPVLEDYLALSEADALRISRYKALKDLSIFRRYGAKFLAEYEMFSSGRIEDGTGYAEKMRRYTGFYYQPESHLFDLVPEFYSLDYVLGWLTEAILERHLRERFGPAWMFTPRAGELLKAWWRQGNRYDVETFLSENGLGTMDPGPLTDRWAEALKSW